MEELERWPDDALPDYALAKRSHAQLGPDAAQLARTLARLDSPNAAAGEGSAGGHAADAPGLGAGKAWWWLLPLIALLGAGVWLARVPQRETASQAPSVRQPVLAPAASAPEPDESAAPVAESAAPVAESAAPVAEPAAPVAEPAAPATPRVARAPRQSPVRAQVAGDAPAAPDPLAELALLERARRVLARDPKRALALTDEHRRSFGAPSFAQERELLAIEALLRLGQRSAAELRAGAFQRDYPGSVHTHRLGVIFQSQLR